MRRVILSPMKLSLNLRSSAVYGISWFMYRLRCTVYTVHRIIWYHRAIEVWTVNNAMHEISNHTKQPKQTMNTWYGLTFSGFAWGRHCCACEWTEQYFDNIYKRNIRRAWYLFVVNIYCVQNTKLLWLFFMCLSMFRNQKRGNN